MDITNESLKSMKAKQLRRLIRESIEEVLNENTAIITTKTGTKSLPFKNSKELDVFKNDSNVSSVETTAGQKIKEGDLDEAKGYKLINPGMDMNQLTNRKTGEPAKIAGILLSDILTTIRDTEGISDKQLFDKFKFNPETGIGFKKVQQLNGMMKGLKDTGIIDRIGRGGEVEAIPEPGEEQPETIDGPESFLIGSGDPLAGMFDGLPNDDGSEDFNDEEEPTTGEMEPGTSATTGGMSDDDYEAFMKYKDLADRLAATKSNLLKLRRNKGGVVGDLRDKPSTEEQRLRDLKKSLEDRVNALVAGSTYLQKKVEKETGKAYEPIEIEPEEEDTIDEAFNREYEKRKLQFYAGIIK
jgi:hypothetical protein